MTEDSGKLLLTWAILGQNAGVYEESRKKAEAAIRAMSDEEFEQLLAMGTEGEKKLMRELRNERR